MKKILFLAFLLASVTSFAQFSNYTNINGRYKWIAGKFDSTFTIPTGTTPSLRTGGANAPGAMFYRTTDSTIYQYTGTQWIKLRGGISPTDTAGLWITDLYRRNGTDSVFYVKGGSHTFAFRDSVGNAGGGGGGGKIYYFNGGVSMGTIGGLSMYELGDTANTGAAANFTRATTGNLANFITDPNKPGLLQIPAGVWTVDAYLSETGGGANHAQIWIEVEKWDGSTITTIATSPIEEITNGSVIDLYTWSVSIPTTSLAITDRIVIQFYISNTNGKTVTLYTQNGYVGEVHTTFTTGIGSLNGLTAPSQFFATGTSGTDFNIASATATHTFNLPTASATNRGALSSADWTTFNSKVGGSGTSGQVAYWTGTSSQSGSNNLFWDAANNRLGIGTASPGHSLTVNGDISLTASQTIRWGSSLGITKTLNQLLIYSGTGSGVNGGTLLHYWNGSAFAVGMQLTNNSNLILQAGGTFTDGGQRLQVNGDALIKGSGNTSGTTALTVQNSDGTNLLRIRNDNTALFGGVALFASFLANTTASSPLQIRANVASLTSLSVDFTSLITAASGAYSVLSIPQGFAPTSGTATLSDISITSTINQTGGANGITRGLYVSPTLTAAADWRSIEWSNNSGWGLYGAGTSNNYLAGALGIGTTSVGNNNIAIGKALTAATSTSVISNVQVQSAVTTAYGFRSRMFTGAGTYTVSDAYHYSAEVTAPDVSSGFTNQYGFIAQSTMTGATNNFGFRGDIPSGTGRWNLYMNGTAANYMNGNLLLGSTTDGGQKLQVTGTTQLTPAANSSALTSTGYSVTGSGATSLIDLSGTWNTTGSPTLIKANVTNTASGASSLLMDLQVGGTSQFQVTKNGNVGIGTSPSYKLDVAGTFRTQDNTYLVETGTGSVGINTNSVNASAILEIKSTAKGFLPPRMTNAQMVAIATPEAGLVVYDTTNNKLNVYDGTNWVTLH